MRGRVTIIFTLSMPNVASWNGKWSGAGKLYAIVRSYATRKAEPILAKPSFYYNFGDGWGARVNVRAATDRSETAKVRRESQGFCGYDWMVDSIERYGAILNDAQMAERNEAVRNE